MAVLSVLVGVTSRLCDLGGAPGIYLEEFDPGHPGAAFLPLQQPALGIRGPGHAVSSV